MEEKYVFLAAFSLLHPAKKLKRLIWTKISIRKNTPWNSARIAREKANYPKTLTALLFAQDAVAVGLLKRKRKPLKRIENKRNIIASTKLDWMS